MLLSGMRLALQLCETNLDSVEVCALDAAVVHDRPAQELLPSGVDVLRTLAHGVIPRTVSSRRQEWGGRVSVQVQVHHGRAAKELALQRQQHIRVGGAPAIQQESLTVRARS